jgi:hypothetical protein
MRLFIREIGTRVCWTHIPTGRFYIGDRDECTTEELAILGSEQGNGYVTCDDSMAAILQ